MLLGQIDRQGRIIETLADKAAHFDKSDFAVLFAQSVVIEAGQDMAFFDTAAQTVVKIVLRFVMNHPVAAGNQKLHGRGNGLRVGDDAFGGLI